MKNYIEEVIKDSGLSISPEAVDCIENAATIYASEFLAMAKLIDGDSSHHQKYDIGIELCFHRTVHPTIRENTRKKYFQNREVHQ